jgi:hypothetical protein
MGNSHTYIHPIYNQAALPIPLSPSLSTSLDMRSLLLLAIVTLSLTSGRRLSEDDFWAPEHADHFLEEEERQRPICSCVNPFLGTPSEYLGDSRGTCARTGTCYVPCDADCSDVRAAKESGRCRSSEACQRRLLFSPVQRA